ncbi:MAG: TVP38/TMEM64 family protein, partial [Rhizobiales bacterium]|nr:TVP38/TMEM64 family protein [Hyphomicrobiales bacterium]
MTQNAAPDRAARKSFPWKRLAILGAIVALAGLVFATGWHRLLSFDTLVARRADLDSFVKANFAGAVAAFIALYVVAVALSLPGATVLTIAGGLLFGWLAGGIAAAVGATLGASAVFLIARFLLRYLVQRRLGPRLKAISDGFREDAFSYLLFLRLVPAFPFFLVNIAPAFAGIGLGAFVAATAIGILPATFAFALFGDGLDSVIAGQRITYDACVAAGQTGCRIGFDPRAVLTPRLIAALCGLGVVALIPVAMKRWRRTRT